jgi:hypothetical protein
MRSVQYARDAVGGEAVHIGNLDPTVGLPRIRRYATNILRDLEQAGVRVSTTTGGLDEYPVAGEKAALALSAGFDLRVVAGLPHAVPGLRKGDVLVTDQSRELRNYIDQGFELSVGEVTTHADVMSTDKVLHSELGDTIREIVDKRFA